MFKKKRKVGRPSNKEIRREKNLKFLSIIGLFFVFTFSVYTLSGYLKNNIDNLKGQVKYGRVGDYCDEKNIKSGNLIIGDSRTCQLYNFNNSYASFNSTWGGHYGYGGETYQIDTQAKRTKMKYYAQNTIKKVGFVNIYIFSTVNDYNGGGNYQGALNNHLNLAKTAYTWKQKYKGKTVRPKVYVVSLVGSKGVNVDDYNNVLKAQASKTKKFDYINITDVVTNDGYLSDNLHYTNETCSKILSRLDDYGKVFQELEGTFETYKKTEKGSTIKTEKIESIIYKIMYNLNGGTGAQATQSYKYNNGDKILIQKPTKNGYTFEGWLNKKTNKVYKPNEEIKNTYGDFELVAVWKANTYTIMYGANGGKNEPATQKFEFNSNAKLSTQKPYREGYTFVNWKHSTSDKTFNPGDPIPKGWGNFVLIAQWKENNVRDDTYTITYNLNGGSNAQTSQKFKYNADERISKQIPTRSGYTFKEWKHNSSSRVFNPGDKIPQDWKDFTLIAVWEVTGQTYTITYNLNGGSGSIYNEVYVAGKGKVTTTKPTKTGYTFVNWKHSTSNRTFKPGEAIPADWKNITLIAQYRINTMTIIYDSAGGKINIMKDKNWGLSGTTVTYGGKVKTHTINYGKTLGQYGLADPDSKSELNLTKKGYKIVKNKEWICASGCTTKNRVYDETTKYKASDFCDASKSDCTVTLKVNWQKK